MWGSLMLVPITSGMILALNDWLNNCGRRGPSNNQMCRQLQLKKNAVFSVYIKAKDILPALLY